MAVADGGRGEQDQGAATLNDNTIVALSSGQPPAAIAILRISGPAAMATVRALAVTLPPARRAAVRLLRDRLGEPLDRALVLAFPGPASATGEDLVELHCHGGRAVVAAVERALLDQPGVRAAVAGEFTRRALLNGRIDLAQAQGLADLLQAETEQERRHAIAAAEGAVSRLIRGWVDRLTTLAAIVEASIDFADEGDVASATASLQPVLASCATIAAEIADVIAAPPVERWQEGWRIVVAGPPNAGKSTLVNLLGRRDAAIVSPQAGTTRDRIEVSVRREGIGYVLIDTAGLRDESDDVIERIGIDRSHTAIAAADLVLWLADDPPPPAMPSLWLHARADLPDRRHQCEGTVLAISDHDTASIDQLWVEIDRHFSAKLTSAVPLHRDERLRCQEALDDLRGATDEDVLLAAAIRSARSSLGSIVGIDAMEQMLDRLFSRFCVGK